MTTRVGSPSVCESNTRTRVLISPRVIARIVGYFAYKTTSKLSLGLALPKCKFRSFPGNNCLTKNAPVSLSGSGYYRTYARRGHQQLRFGILVSCGPHRLVQRLDSLVHLIQQRE